MALPGDELIANADLRRLERSLCAPRPPRYGRGSRWRPQGKCGGRETVAPPRRAPRRERPTICVCRAGSSVPTQISLKRPDLDARRPHRGRRGPGRGLSPSRRAPENHVWALVQIVDERPAKSAIGCGYFRMRTETCTDVAAVSDEDPWLVRIIGDHQRVVCRASSQGVVSCYQCGLWCRRARCSSRERCAEGLDALRVGGVSDGHDLSTTATSRGSV